VSPSPAKPSVQSLVRDYLKRRPEEQIGRRELAAVRRHVLEGLPAPRRIPDRYLIEVLEEAGADVARSLGGLPQDLRGRVHSGSFEAAASSLLDMQAEFSAAWGRGSVSSESMSVLGSTGGCAAPTVSSVSLAMAASGGGLGPFASSCATISRSCKASGGETGSGSTAGSCKGAGSSGSLGASGSSGAVVGSGSGTSAASARAVVFNGSGVLSVSSGAAIALSTTACFLLARLTCLFRPL